MNRPVRDPHRPFFRQKERHPNLLQPENARKTKNRVEKIGVVRYNTITYAKRKGECYGTAEPLL